MALKVLHGLTPSCSPLQSHRMPVMTTITIFLPHWSLGSLNAISSSLPGPLNFLFFLPGMLSSQDLCMDDSFSSFKSELKCHLREAFPTIQPKRLHLLFSILVLCLFPSQYSHCLYLGICLLACLLFVFSGKM